MLLGFSKAGGVKIFKNTQQYESADFPDYLVGMNGLYDDLFSKSKGFRSQLVANISFHLNLDKEVVSLLQQTVEFIHSASLLHDDLIDRSQLRRNKTTAWLKYSPEYAILSGDYLMASVMRNLSRYGNLEMVQYTAEVALDLIEGEWIQDATVKNWNIDPVELDRIYYLKTSSLFKWCLKAPFICKKKYDKIIYEELEKLGSDIGILFQRSDDLIDFDVRNEDNKTILSDLQSGYLNSFGAFLFQRLSEVKREEFKECKTIEDVYALNGRTEFDQVVCDFDESNQKLIAECQTQLEKISRFLCKEEMGLIEDLQKIPALLYWRKLEC